MAPRHSGPLLAGVAVRQATAMAGRPSCCRRAGCPSANRSRCSETCCSGSAFCSPPSAPSWRWRVQPWCRRRCARPAWIIILQDGSASMRVQDVAGDRWRRSMRFLRALGESLRWKEDRIAMALFAHIATPQIRLTKDPNTYFFFLDHLDRESPFRSRGRRDVGHEHRAGHLLGRAADREGRGDERPLAQREGVRADLRRPGGRAKVEQSSSSPRQAHSVFVIGGRTAAGASFRRRERRRPRRFGRRSMWRRWREFAAAGGGRTSSSIVRAT